MNNKLTPVVVLVGALSIGGILLFSGNLSSQTVAGTADNVSMIDGKQVIEINVKGGYSPRQTVAKAGIPTVIKFNTNGTFDCSSGVRFPSIGISKTLPPSGTTEVDLGVSNVATLQGVCVMGMYSFQIDFQG